MKKSAAAVAAAVAVLALGLLSGVALAGDHGLHGSHDARQSTTSDQQPGVKPSNDTFKDQTCTTGGGQGSSATCQSSTYPGTPDASKRYGNGKTAAQIANGKGAPSGTPIYGPGNSQPHKICGRDVHAYGKGRSATCGSKEEQPPPTTQPKEVYVCHATGSATNPYVLIRISLNGWLSGHARHQDGRDILLGDKPGPCPTASTQSAAATTAPTTTGVTTTTAATTTTTAATTTTTAAATTTTTSSTTTTTKAAASLRSSTSTPPPPSGSGGVLGASKTLHAPSAHHAPGGVLGVAKTLGTSATSGTLPFTGLRLWIFGVIALGLIGAGLAMRLVAGRRTN